LWRIILSRRYSVNSYDMPTLRDIIERNDTCSGRVFDLTIQALIVVSLITFSLETLPDLPVRSRKILHAFEVITVAIFTAEYLTRLAIANNKLQFATSFFGVVDLLAILPFYITTGIDLRAIRAIRLLRLFRIFKLARYSIAARRFHTALLIAREEIGGCPIDC
jgi:voltage-gated potassium channel